MALPDLDGAPVGGVLADSPAVRLFVERARAARADFDLTPENAPSVAAICRRLDGLPLAIELAAARIALFAPAELLDRLDRAGGGRLPLLTGGPRDAPSRQRTLRDAIAWSHDLLDPNERVLFRRLSVFAGGFDLETAEAVVGAAKPALDVVEGVGALVAKSLLVRTDGIAGGGSRFAVLETIREFAAGALAESGEEDAVRQAHAAAFRALAERADADLLGPRQASRLATLEVEHDNLRAALAWADARGDAAMLLRLAGALARFWRFHWHQGDGQRWLVSALARDDGQPTTWRAKALIGAGVMANMRCDYVAAEACHREALKLYQAVGDRWATARVLFHLGEAIGGQGDEGGSAECFEMALALFRDLGERQLTALVLKDLGELARRRGDYDRAAALLDEALALDDEAGFGWGRAEALARVAEVARDRGDPARVAAALGEALVLYREQGDTVGVARVVSALALLAGERGQTEAAVRLYGAAAGLHEALGLRQPQDKHPEHQARLDGFRARLGQADFAVGWGAGWALSRDAVIVEAAALAEALASSASAAAPTGASAASYPAGFRASARSGCCGWLRPG